LTLVEAAAGACIMLTDDNLCRIQAAKPRQCQAFPERWRFPGFEKLCRATRQPDP
jgi:Fe-S-cluster containining protein